MKVCGGESPPLSLSKGSINKTPANVKHNPRRAMYMDVKYYIYTISSLMVAIGALYASCAQTNLI